MTCVSDPEDRDRVILDRTTELQETAKTVQTLAEDVPVYVFTNNHYAGHVPQPRTTLLVEIGATEVASTCSSFKADTRTMADAEGNWTERQRDWQRRLRRIRFGAEPVEEQVERYRRVTWALTVVPLAIGLMFVALFWAFRRPDVGVLLAVILLLPVISIAWLDYLLLSRRVQAYLNERKQHEERKPTGS